MGAAIDTATTKNKIYVTVNEFTNGWNVQYGTKSMGSDNTAAAMPVIANGQFIDTPTNKPTPWSSNPLVAFESDHGKTSSLGAHPSSVSYGWTVTTLVQTTNVLNVG